MHRLFDSLFVLLPEACVRHYGDRLVSVAVFGSVGRGTPRQDSDVDLLIVANGLPDGRIARVEEFRAVEQILAPWIHEAKRAGLSAWLSPVFKTRAELDHGSLLLLDMIDDRRLLFDREDVLRRRLDRLRTRLDVLGSRRIWRGNAWYWDLKPDYVPGDVIEL